jgi:hypothetical protein
MKRLSLALALLVIGCGDGKVTQQSGAAACLTASACGIIDGGVSACTQVIAFINDPALAGAAKVSAAEVNCIANAGSDCAAARKCLANGMTPAACSGVSESCAGNVWQSCTVAAGSGGNEGIQLFDCGDVGQMCVANNGNVDCGYGSCSGGTASCVTPDGMPGGNLVQRCDNGILKREDCTRTSASCNPSGVAHCRGDGPACSAPGIFNNTLRCDGSVLVSCVDGGEARYDCGKVNLGCFANVGGNGFACAAGNECDPNNYTATCVGTKLTFCNKGKVQSADCASAGFATCSPNNGGSCSS